MIEKWNPKFGFYLPINTKVSKSIHELKESDYGDSSGPIPLVELWSDTNSHVENLDELASFGSKAINKSSPRIGDIIATCDYSKIFYCKHYIFTKQHTSSEDIYYCKSIKSKKYKKRNYIFPGLGSNSFVMYKVGPTRKST